MLASPLQLSYAVSIIANRGEALVPHLLGQIEDPLEHKAMEPEIHERSGIEISDAGNWDRVIDAMVGVVHGPRGTARRSGAGAAFRFAGKTGTAQVFAVGQDEEVDADTLPEHLRDHALFIAFAPAEHPQIAVAVVVEHGGSGSRMAAPIARRVLDRYLTAQTPVPPSG
jgi:penicillin-binding protein 2